VKGYKNNVSVEKILKEHSNRIPLDYRFIVDQIIENP
jgi:hypothetical protein